VSPASDDPVVDAVVFDLDGVLLDSEQLWDEVRRGLAAQAGRSWPTDATRAMQGMSTPEWSDYLAVAVGIPGRAQEIATAVINAMADRYLTHLPLLPGAHAAVERLAEHWPLGLASSSPRQLIDSVLRSARLTDHFQVTVSTEEVAVGKPSPLVYLTAVKRLGVDPARAVAIEDSTNGLRSASAAGLIVCALPHPACPPAADALDLAAVTVNSLADLTPDLIAALVSR
jgi:HAD superfamily hydrolase (TIGR01509 family)